MRQPHSTVYRGKKVFVELKDGTAFVGKFYEKQGTRIRFYDHGEVRQGDLSKFIIYKPKT